MRIILFLLVLTSFKLKAQTDSIVNNRLYQHIEQTPKTNDIIEIFEHFEKISEDENELLEISFYWISKNIEYDLELSRKSVLTSSDISIEKSLTTGKTICSGYSQLLCVFASLADIECNSISGIGQNYLDPKIDSLYTNHAWNIVLIEDEWKLIDATWGSGSYQAGSDGYTQQIDMRYFLADPRFLLIDHLPEESEWQLIDPPITYSEFWGEYWSEMRFRKFNQLINEEDYQIHLRVLKNAKRNNSEN
jgi:transglutaminase/protease-like cytokinesis protein 3